MMIDKKTVTESLVTAFAEFEAIVAPYMVLVSRAMPMVTEVTCRQIAEQLAHVQLGALLTGYEHSDMAVHARPGMDPAEGSVCVRVDGRGDLPPVQVKVSWCSRGSEPRAWRDVDLYAHAEAEVEVLNNWAGATTRDSYR